MEKINIDNFKRLSVNVLGVNLEGVVLVYGDTASGKTAFSLKVMEKFLREGRKVLYISTEKKTNDFERIEKIISKYPQYKDNLTIYATMDINEIWDIINEHNADLIIVDNLEFAYKNDEKKRARNMYEFCTFLKEKTFREKSLAIITVHVYKRISYTNVEGYLTPIGGLRFYSATNVRIWLKKTPSFRKRIMNYERGEKVIEIEEGFIVGDEDDKKDINN